MPSAGFALECRGSESFERRRYKLWLESARHSEAEQFHTAFIRERLLHPGGLCFEKAVQNCGIFFLIYFIECFVDSVVVDSFLSQ